jgi:assimilatory nitrate reductase catalytic subunit
LLLNTGRVRDQWHSMTRTGLAPFLMRHTPEPMVAIHPLDAAVRRIGQGALVRISTAEGDVLMRADLRRTQRPGEVFAPMHWTDQFASAGPIGRLVSAKVDPLSGQPELKATPVDVTPAVVHFHGLLLRRTGAALPASCHWVRVPVAGGQMYRLAGLHPMPHADDLARFAAGLLALPEGTGRLEASDQRRGVLRMAAVRDGALEACLFLARDAASLPNAAALIPMLGAPLPDAARSNLLAGRINRATAAGGAKVCACFGVARNAIRDAVARHRLASVHQIGALLRAGTNCGSCIPELEEILRDVHVSAG